MKNLMILVTVALVCLCGEVFASQCCRNTCCKVKAKCCCKVCCCKNCKCCCCKKVCH